MYRAGDLALGVSSSLPSQGDGRDLHPGDRGVRHPLVLGVRVGLAPGYHLVVVALDAARRRGSDDLDDRYKCKHREQLGQHASHRFAPPVCHHGPGAPSELLEQLGATHHSVNLTSLVENLIHLARASAAVSRAVVQSLQTQKIYQPHAHLHSSVGQTAQVTHFPAELDR